jgi:hypothetical protein
VSLSALLNSQPGTRVIHEGDIEGKRHPFNWEGDGHRVVRWLRMLEKRFAPFEYFGDVGFYFLPYVEDILSEWSSARFVVMKRDRAETVASYERKTEGRNHWMEHDGVQWRLDPRWDPAYPTYPAANKREALERYWDEYYQRASELAVRHPEAVRIFDVSALNTPNGRASLLTFTGMDIEKADLDSVYHENAIQGSTDSDPGSGRKLQLGRTWRSNVHRLLQRLSGGR